MNAIIRYTSTAVTFLAIAAVPQTAPADVASGLVAQYTFSKNGRDTSGRGNHARLENTSLTADRFGAEDRALEFVDGSGVAVVTNSQSLQVSGSAITLSAWVYPTTFVGASERRTIARKMPVSGGQGGYLFALGENGIPQFGFRTQSPDYYEAKGFNGAPALNAWTHLVVTYDGNAVRFYRNGNLTDTYPQGGALGVNNDPLTIGRISPDVSADSFYGALDEVRIYNRVLTAADVTELYAREINEPPVARFQISPRAEFPGYTNLIVIARNNKGANVTLTAPNDSDNTNEVVQQLWYIDGRPVGSGTNLNLTLRPGTYRTRLVVADAYAEAEEDADIYVLTPAQGVGLLFEMVQQSNLTPAQKRALKMNLNAAIRSFETQNRMLQRPLSLQAFQRKVSALVAPIDPDLAAELIYGSELILDAIR